MVQVNLLALKDKDPAAYGLTRASLIQKLIRRSMLPEALWVVKLFLDDGHEKGLRRRLLQISAEDVGLVCPTAINYIHTEPDLYKCVALLCLSQKNREVDQFLLNVAYRKSEYKNADKNTRQEIEVLEYLLRASEEWFLHRRQKSYLTKLKEDFSYLANLSGEMKETVLLAGEIYIDLTRHNVHGARVMLALIALLSARKISPVELPDLSILPPLKPLDLVPDYALDMHTPAGRDIKRSFDHWVKEGAKVDPQFNYPSMFDAKGEVKYPLLPLVPFLAAQK